MIDFSEREVKILNDSLRALFSETVASVSKEKNAGKNTPVEDAYIEEIKLLMGRLKTGERGKEVSVSDIGTRIQLIDDLLKTDLEIVHMAFGVSESLGKTAIGNCISAFRSFLEKESGPFVNGMNAEYRAYVVGLLSGIDERYRGSATETVLLGLPPVSQSREGGSI